MANATQNRDALHGVGDMYSYGVASGAQLFAGTIGAINVQGHLIKAAAGATTLAGVIADAVNNTSTNTSLTSVVVGGLSARVMRRGIYRFNANITPIQAHVGLKAFPTDDQTVGTTVAAGISGGIQYLGDVVGFGTTPYNYYDVDIKMERD